MKTEALRMYGTNDIRVESFDLSDCGADELLAEVVCDSLCLSTWKAIVQGSNHKRIPDDIAEQPTIMGHEFSGRIREVGENLTDRYSIGQCFAVQPALYRQGESWKAIGFSFPESGGDATYMKLTAEILDHDCFIPWNGSAFYQAALAEPFACLLHAVRAQYHIVDGQHVMGVCPDGCCALLAACGPMGLGMAELLLGIENGPSRIVMTDIDDERLARARTLFAGRPVHIIDARTETITDACDDVFVFAAVEPVVSLADSVLAEDGCLNFFAGPTDTQFTAPINFHSVHYRGTHIIGTTGSTTKDLRDVLQLIEQEQIEPAIMLSHIGGLKAAEAATMNLPELGGGKKIIYPHSNMPLTAIADLATSGYPELAKACTKHGGLWNKEAEALLIAD